MAAHFGHNYVKKYYMGTYLGLLWLLLLPLLDILMRSLLFGGFLGVSSGGRPYFLFLCVGSISWYFYERAAYWSYRSLQYNHRYFRAVPVPWLPAVLGSAIPGLVQAGVYLLIALVVSCYYQLTRGSFYLHFGLATGWAIVGLLLLICYAWTVGLFFAPLVFAARDIRLLIRFPLNFWYLVTPILYSIDSLPHRYRGIALYNPLTAPVELMRHGLLQMSFPAQSSLIVSVAALVVLLPLGLLSFARAERASHIRL